MKTVIIGSQNPVKIDIAKEVFAMCFPKENFTFITHHATSNVGDQPQSSPETKLGAQNRSDDCKRVHATADYFVGLEGGVERDDNQYWAFGWMCIQDQFGNYGYGRTGTFALPTSVSDLIDQGQELSRACDIVFNENNSGYKQGAIGILTNNIVTRKDLYRNALVYALIPFLKPELYKH
ncbi:MAG: inosine/xanthosine triphosphatase [Patescibacteria group bacterium]